MSKYKVILPAVIGGERREQGDVVTLGFEEAVEHAAALIAIEGRG